MRPSMASPAVLSRRTFRLGWLSKDTPHVVQTMSATANAKPRTSKATIMCTPAGIKLEKEDLRSRPSQRMLSDKRCLWERICEDNMMEHDRVTPTQLHSLLEHCT
jgi:hypothetical protein